MSGGYLNLWQKAPKLFQWAICSIKQVTRFRSSQQLRQIATSRNAVKRAIIYHRRQAFFGVLRSREGSIRSLLAEAGFGQVCQGETTYHNPNCCTHRLPACTYCCMASHIRTRWCSERSERVYESDVQQGELNWSRTSSLKRSHISDVISINFTQKDAKHGHWGAQQRPNRKPTGHRRQTTPES